MNDHTASPSEQLRTALQDPSLSLLLDDSHYRTLLDHAPVALAVQHHGAIQYANTLALELLMAPSIGALASKSLTDLIHPDDRPHFIECLMHPPGQETFLPCETRCLRLDGTSIWTEVVCVEIKLGIEAAFEITLRDITKRKQNEARIRRQALVMDGINRTLHAALKYETEEELGRACLEVAQEITQSTTGFLGEMRTGTFMKIALSLHPGSDEKISKSTIHSGAAGNFDLHRLLGPVLVRGKSFFTNDIAVLSDSMELPTDHPALRSFLGVPLFHEGRVVGMIGLANRPGGYSESEQESIEALAPAIVEAFVRERMEAEMQKLYAQTRRDAITKTDLLNEINHRVKNNLMTILGLILAEKRHMAAGLLSMTGHIWEKFELRIAGLLKVHQILSDSQWMPMNISELASSICSGVLDSFGLTDGIALAVSDSRIDVTPRQANNIALIFNELMTNSLKYAFDQTREPKISVSIGEAEDMAVIEFRDNGAGFQPDMLDHGRHHVGLNLVRHLVEDTLDGEMTLFNDGGSVTVLKIRIEARAETGI
ncbi:MAG: GAF domain-containing protein [Acidobacteriota bacterium]